MMLTPNHLFNLLSDETRLRCLLLLSQNKELCVCEICHVIGSIQPKISRHLAILRSAGIVLDERKGQWVYYQLNPHLDKWVQNIIAATLQELKTVHPYSLDLKKTKNLCKNLCE